MIDKRKLCTNIIKIAQNNSDYYKFGKPTQIGIIEEIMTFLGIDYIISSHSQSMHQENYETLKTFLINHATDEQIHHIHDLLEYNKELPKNNINDKAYNLVFIACSMNENDCSDFENIENTLCEAIKKTGYEPYLAERQMEPNDITQEILEHIRNCKFAVCDFTSHNRGVYYEAGYAKAMGKRVFHTFRPQDKNDKLHFDIASTRCIFWKTYNDLQTNLYNSIIDTFGRGDTNED